MNSGCYGDDISKILISIKAIDIKDCKEKEISRDKISFYYRGTNLPSSLIITSVKLKGKITDKNVIKKKQLEMIEKKKLTQPSQIKTCGSTFKNFGTEKKAWQLIKETGCDKFFEGDAIISKKHCNFFVNNGKAKSSDIEKLINKVKQTVNDKTGINLELEIKIIGEKKKKYKRVTVILGGTSGEREVSLNSGRACIKALKKNCLVSKFDPKFKNLNLINKFKTDVIFNALHGKDGEDGIAQSYFEYLNHILTLVY